MEIGHVHNASHDRRISAKESRISEDTVGILSERDRWSQCVEWTNKKLGMAVGALFIRDNFNHESKVIFIHH